MQLEASSGFLRLARMAVLPVTTAPAGEGAEILEAFRTYYTTAELSATTDPNLVLDLRAKLDAAGHYDDFD